MKTSETHPVHSHRWHHRLRLLKTACAVVEAALERGRAGAVAATERRSEWLWAAESGDATAMVEARVGELEAALESKTNEAAETATRAQEALASQLVVMQAQTAAADAAAARAAND